MGGSAGISTYLVCRSQGQLCALPLEHVIETMRPLPLKPLADMPVFVAGICLIRGAAVPVLDMAKIVGGASATPGRFVTIRTGKRQAGVAVENVVGVRSLSSQALSGAPPLLRTASGDIVSAVTALDRDLLLVLQATHLVPDSVWATVDAQAWNS